MARKSLDAQIHAALTAYRDLRAGRAATGEVLAEKLRCSGKSARRQLSLLTSVYGLKLTYLPRAHSWEILGPAQAIRYLDWLTGTKPLQ
jgi:hypothetical protein